MSDRQSELRNLASQIRTEEQVDDAFLAKSFTDILLIIDIYQGKCIPETIQQQLSGYDLRAAESVYGEEDDAPSLLGNVGDVNRHHFVDTQTRGTHQSYVVE